MASKRRDPVVLREVESPAGSVETVMIVIDACTTTFSRFVSVRREFGDHQVSTRAPLDVENAATRSVELDT